MVIEIGRFFICPPRITTVAVVASRPLRARHRSTPLFWAHIPGMAREQPMVTIQILGSILEFAVHSLVQVFNNRNSGRFGVFEMCLDVFDKYGQALCPKAK